MCCTTIEIHFELFKQMPFLDVSSRKLTVSVKRARILNVKVSTPLRPALVSRRRNQPGNRGNAVTEIYYKVSESTRSHK